MSRFEVCMIALAIVTALFFAVTLVISIVLSVKERKKGRR